MVRYPMYSMSTEVVETLPFYRGRSPVFLPIAKGVRYEFLPVGSSDIAENLLESWQLSEGEEYTLVVSDAYGLIRYQTEDVFLCAETSAVGELPDLRFQRRRGLRWSFTGEKLTGEQVATAVWAGAEFPCGELDWIAMAPLNRRGQPGLCAFGGDTQQRLGPNAGMDALLGTANSSSKPTGDWLSPTRTIALSKEEYISLWAVSDTRRVGRPSCFCPW